MSSVPACAEAPPPTLAFSSTVTEASGELRRIATAVARPITPPPATTRRGPRSPAMAGVPPPEGDHREGPVRGVGDAVLHSRRQREPGTGGEVDLLGAHGGPARALAHQPDLLAGMTVGIGRAAGMDVEDHGAVGQPAGLGFDVTGDQDGLRGAGRRGSLTHGYLLMAAANGSAAVMTGS